MKLEDLEITVCEACGFESDDIYRGLCLKCRAEKKREDIHDDEGTIPDESEETPQERCERQLDEYDPIADHEAQQQADGRSPHENDIQVDGRIPPTEKGGVVCD